MIFAAQRGFAVDREGVKYVMSRVAADGRKGCAKHVPCDGAISRLQMQASGTCFLQLGKKGNAKLRLENYNHVKNYADAP